MRFTNRDATPFPSQPSTVRADVVLECVDPRGRSVEVPTTLSYSSNDPFAIRLTFRSNSESVDWLVGRNLLHLGTSGPVGRGDVRVYPSIDDGGRAVIMLDLHSPDGRLVAQVETAEVQAFLTQTFAIVPSGTEAAFLDMDGLISELLAT